jgi:nitrite reductase/ring-hydroxylating ferredoxin subunit
MDYTYVASLKDLQPGTAQAVRAGGNSILLVNLEGDVYALSNLCTHQKCYLHKGKLEGKAITCPCHFAQFDVTTGAVLSGRAKTPLATYSVKIEKDDILIGI